MKVTAATLYCAGADLSDVDVSLDSVTSRQLGLPFAWVARVSVIQPLFERPPNCRPIVVRLSTLPATAPSGSATLG